MEIQITSRESTQFIDITDLIQSALEEWGATEGACLLYVPHTTCAITVNEGADPDVVSDLIHHLDKLAQGPYKHREGNGPAHLKASLLGSSVIIPLLKGRLSLGTWQRIFFCEFDGPRQRNLNIKVLSP